MKRIRKSLLNIFVLASMLLGIGYLLHDFVFLTFVPFFKHEFYCITYFGLLTDLCAYGAIRIGAWHFEEVFK